MKKYNPEFIERHINGVKINCNSNRPANERILALIYAMTYKVSQTLSRPCGYHIRVRFTKRMTASSFSARLAGYFQRKSRYKPLWVCAAETDPEQDELHYHYAIILDARHDSIKSLWYLLGKLQKNGFINDYHIKSHDDAPRGLLLNSSENLAKYLYWLSYIGKTKTKPSGRQTYSSSHSISMAARNWVKKGKPPLHLMHSSAADITSDATLQKFIDHNLGLAEERNDDSHQEPPFTVPPSNGLPLKTSVPVEVLTRWEPSRPKPPRSSFVTNPVKI